LLPNKFDKYIPFLLVILGLIVYSLAENIFMIKNAYNGNIISFYVSALCGILFVLLLSKLITKVALVSYLGRYSIIVLGTHWIIITILNRFLFFITNVWLLTGVIFILVAFISIPVIKFFLKYFPKFVSQEDLIRVDPIVDITNNDRLLSEQNESVEKK
jgi:fucose 4-O-acetylase-like acetyltransferase